MLGRKKSGLCFENEDNSNVQTRGKKKKTSTVRLVFEWFRST
jgi:hypothetical protein